LVPNTLEAAANPSQISCHFLQVNWQHQSEIWSEKYYGMTNSVNCNKVWQIAIPNCLTS
jgi:hypothetical protein